MGSGQDADNWSIGYEMADPSKKLLTLKAVLLDSTNAKDQNVNACQKGVGSYL